jgi:D-cysteine desulfhydrase family pyridoxal phosphate-dependent enzyme
MIEETNVVRDLPRLRLAQLPTPLERASRLEEALRAEGTRPPRMYIKRDDLLSLAMGGNKIRNLEFSLGAAIADGVTDVITMGRAQSNHCRLTAAACVRAGLRAHLVMSGARPAAAKGNLLLTELLGASVHFTGTDDRAMRDATAARICEEIAARGGRPLLLPVGGSDARGAVGHALLAHEIVRQCEAAGETPDVIVLATATGGTQAGLIVGLRVLALDTRVVGFTVHEPAVETSHKVAALAAAGVAILMGTSRMEPAAVCVDDTQFGAGYGVPSPAGTDALLLLARTEGLVLDPVYTAKAMAGLLALVREGRLTEDSSVVFVHTGGAPALFADLPATAM